METINGATVVFPDPGGAAAEAARGPAVFGPEQGNPSYLAWIWAAPPDEVGPPVHVHPDTDEGFYVAEGELTFILGDREVVAGPGTFVFVPRGVAHTVRTTGGGPMRGLLILSPGGAEHVSRPVEAP